MAASTNHGSVLSNGRYTGVALAARARSLREHNGGNGGERKRPRERAHACESRERAGKPELETINSMDCRRQIYSFYSAPSKARLLIIGPKRSRCGTMEKVAGGKGNLHEPEPLEVLVCLGAEIDGDILVVVHDAPHRVVTGALPSPRVGPHLVSHRHGHCQRRAGRANGRSRKRVG